MSAARWYRPPALGDALAPLLVVEASAGTGKTWFLERRVIDLILHAGATIDQILVVTFTDKATAELRSRVRGQLARMVHGQPDAFPADAGPDDVWIVDEAARARLRAALDSFDAAPISTIHGFCHRVLAEESFAARRPFEQEQVPDDAVLRAAFTAALRERFALDPAEAELLGQYLGEGTNTVDKLFRLVLEVYRSGAELAAPRAGAVKAEEILVPRLAEEVIARADRSKQRQGQLDFQDMLRLTAAALDGAAGTVLAARIAERHPWALIDEFQDTDPLQWQIFQRVWAQAPARGLMVVGDPKQAIYSFRGGDVHTYVRATSELTARGARRVVLDVCQRSTAPLVNAVNCLLKHPAEVFGKGEIRYDNPVKPTGEVTATWPDGRPVEPLAFMPIVVEGKILAPQFRTAVAEATADEIARLLRDPARRITGTRRGQAAVLRASDILVLTRKNDEAYDVAEAIRRRGVPCALARAEYLFDTAEARAVCDVLDAVARPRDRTARLRAWMSCFFDVDPDDLGRALEVPDDHVMASRLHDWRAHGVRMDYPRLFAAILTDSRVAERALATGRGERIVTNIHHVFEHLHAEVERSRCELPELVARLRGWIRAAGVMRPDDSDVQRQETDRDAVQVMTVHRAKGLEAWVVFVAGLVMFTERQDTLHSYHDAEGRRRVAVRSNEDAKEHAAIEKDAEDARLAYVALTRARARLYLPVLPDRPPPKGRVKRLTNGGWKGAYAAIHDNLRALAGRRAELPGLADEWVPARPVGPDVDVRSIALPAVIGEVAAVPDLAARDQVGWVVTSYTRLKEQARAAGQGSGSGPAVSSKTEVEPAEMTGEDRSPVPPGPHDLPGGASTGQYLHEVLEHVDFTVALAEPFDTWLLRPEVMATFTLAERHHGVDAAHRRTAAKIVWDTITLPHQVGATTLPPLGRASRLAREVEFAYPIPDGPGGRGRGFVKGFIDLIVTWPGDERWYVVDYKSDVIDVSVDAPRLQVDHHYLVQAELYALACARMLRLGDAADHAARFGGLLYWFLRSRRVVHLAPTAEDLARYHANLAGRATL